MNQTGYINQFFRIIPASQEPMAAAKTIQKTMRTGKHKNKSMVTARGFRMVNPRVEAVVTAAAKAA